MPGGSESVPVEATEAKSSSLSAMGKQAGVKNNQTGITTVGLTAGSSTVSGIATSCANLLAPPKVSSSFGFVSGENVRSLSPAEQAWTSYIYHSHERTQICLYACVHFTEQHNMTCTFAHAIHIHNIHIQAYFDK